MTKNSLYVIIGACMLTIALLTYINNDLCNIIDQQDKMIDKCYGITYHRGE